MSQAEKMTCNEAIVLLCIYCGNFNGKKRRGTDDRDVAALLQKGLIVQPFNDGALHCTLLGSETVSRMLLVGDQKMIDQ